MEGFVLVIEKGPKPGARMSFNIDRIVIGRLASCDLVLSNPYVSRQHLEIQRTDDGFVVRYLKSRRGTFVDGHMVEETPLPLHDGSLISLGMAVVTLRFRTEDSSRTI